MGQQWYESHRRALVQQDNPLVIMASARTDVHVKKAALLFSLLDNDPADLYIHKDAFSKALVLGEYLQKVVEHLYANFNFSEEKRLETKIVEILAETPNKTARQICQKIKWASSKQVNEACRELFESGTLSMTEAGRRKEYAVLPDWA